MGGEWRVGAPLIMESVPAKWRSPVSGLLQAGYPSGYLLASVLYLALPWLGWRGMVMVGVLPALLVFYIRRGVPESSDSFPGLVYQLGNVLAAANANIPVWLAQRFDGDYAMALALVVGVVAALIAVMVALGREPKGTRMGADPRPHRRNPAAPIPPP